VSVTLAGLSSGLPAPLPLQASPGDRTGSGQQEHGEGPLGQLLGWIELLHGAGQCRAGAHQAAGGGADQPPPEAGILRCRTETDAGGEHQGAQQGGGHQR
jgi:hypothetical protein